MSKSHSPRHQEIHDFISEEEFTNQRQGISADPQDDSPGDSEKDAGVEFALGMEYQPDEDGLDPDQAEDIQSPTTALERPNDLTLTPDGLRYRIPYSAMVKFSEQPAPWEDRDRPTSSN